MNVSTFIAVAGFLGAALGTVVLQQQKESKTNASKHVFNTQLIFNIAATIMFILVAAVGFVIGAVPPKAPKLQPVLQSVAIINPAGEMVAQYDNSNGDLEITHTGYDTVKITVAGKQYTYVGAMVEVIENMPDTAGS